MRKLKDLPNRMWYIKGIVKYEGEGKSDVNFPGKEKLEPLIDTRYIGYNLKKIREIVGEKLDRGIRVGLTKDNDIAVIITGELEELFNRAEELTLELEKYLVHVRGFLNYRMSDIVLTSHLVMGLDPTYPRHYYGLPMLIKPKKPVYRYKERFTAEYFYIEDLIEACSTQYGIDIELIWDIYDILLHK